MKPFARFWANRSHVLQHELELGVNIFSQQVMIMVVGLSLYLHITRTIVLK